MNDFERDIEVLAATYIEEVVDAGGARFMVANDLGDFISELVLNNFDRRSLDARAVKFVHDAVNMLLLPEECRQQGIQVDAETVAKLKESLR